MGELFDRYERALKAGKTRGGAVKISGAGKVSGGVYESVLISGAATVDGDIEAERVNVSGSATFRGSVAGEEVTISGSAKVEGSVKGGVFKAAGSLSVAGTVECEEVRTAGALRARAVKGKVVRLAGAFKIEEELSAPLVELKLSNDSNCRYIRGDEVSIERSEGFLQILPFKLIRKGKPALKVELLESKQVRVKDVIIEGRVKAERVELHGNAEVRGSVEGEVVKL